MINIRDLIDDTKCYQTVPELRWPDGTSCPHCSSNAVIKDGKDDTQPHRQRYLCHDCRKRFDDLTGTIFAGHHQPLRTWIICLYFMGLNLSTLQIARELDIHQGDAQVMVQSLRQGVVDRRPAVALEGEVECDEVSVVAGHQGNPEAVEKMMTAMASARSTSTRWRVSGRSCGVGCVRTEGSRRRSCRSTSGSSSSSTTSGPGVRAFWGPCWPSFWHHPGIRHEPYPFGREVDEPFDIIGNETCSIKASIWPATTRLPLIEK